MTPTQRVKCDLLGISIEPWTTNKAELTSGWWVMRNSGTFSFHILCTPEEGVNPVSWETKRFKTINSAIEAASNPSKFGLAWDN